MISRHAPHLMAALLALSTASVVSADSHLPSIAAVRQLAVGSTVTIRGTVSVPTNAFDPGFAVQQGSAGIYVIDSDSGPRALNDKVEITGTLVNSSGLLAIDPTSIRALGRGDRVEPREKSTGSVGESTEGRLLELEGEVVGEVIDDSPFGFIVHIDDGSGPVQLFLYPGSGVSTAGLVDGVTVQVVCFSSQFDTHYECDPRRPSDLKIKHHHGHD